MRSRSGVALLAALWLIVAIAVVVLQFSLVAAERRQLGLTSLERARYRALAAGGLSATIARFEYDLRNVAMMGGNTRGLRSSDPWLGIDSLYSGQITLDSMPVDLVAFDLGTTVNINQVQEQQLTLLFGFILNDGIEASKLARAILDWRDADDNPRLNGAERQQYIDDDYLVLPTNTLFRDVDDLIHVYGMTPETLELIRPYLTTFGTQMPNANTAPEAVLRSIPGMTDRILQNILALRSQGRRIQNLEEISAAVGPRAPAQQAGGRGGPPSPPNAQQSLAQGMAQTLTFTTSQVLLTLYVGDAGSVQPTKLVAMVTRSGQQVNSTWQLW